MRHQGFGRKLMNQVIEQLHELGVRRIWANPEKTNKATVAMLEHLGFKQVEEKVFYQHDEGPSEHEWGTE